jgi:hypothetical protein
MYDFCKAAAVKRYRLQTEVSIRTFTRKNNRNMFTITSQQRLLQLHSRSLSSKSSSTSSSSSSSSSSTSLKRTNNINTINKKIEIKTFAQKVDETEKADVEDEDDIAAIERRLKNSKNRVKLTPRERKEKESIFPKKSSNDDDNNLLSSPKTLFDDLGMKRSMPQPGANGMLSMWEGDPEAWDEMEVSKKLWVVWSGEKGWMYWMNQGSLYAAAFIAFLWVCFRFIGPILGLYELK